LNDDDAQPVAVDGGRAFFIGVSTLHRLHATPAWADAVAIASDTTPHGAGATEEAAAAADAQPDNGSRSIDDHAGAPAAVNIDGVAAVVDEDVDDDTAGSMRRHFAASRIQAVARGASARRLVDELRLEAATSAAAAVAVASSWQDQQPFAPLDDALDAPSQDGDDAAAAAGVVVDDADMEADSVAGDDAGAAAAAVYTWLGADPLLDNGDGDAPDGAAAEVERGGEDAASDGLGDGLQLALQQALQFDDSLAMLPLP
jgi:hypothetical protein